MEFTSLSGSTNFITERDFRLKWIKDKKIWNLIASKVINAKLQPITPRTVRNTFNAEKYDDLTSVQLAVWLESESIISKVISESKTYAATNKK